ncbi:PspC domain-containing protein [Streptacidiphilus fuscans]|uniref:PspC domain-containing protein n=1 Tax=Streptacidiphilus fuscans TaxID=2789292 RepID=A0A931FBW0_9ACTN|nr:PspC domain-containing protein [Streptacidiphilus fuscans]MBF9067848.1 PspC domain-containing protein [Streptacidiphilus fuscans]
MDPTTSIPPPTDGDAAPGADQERTSSRPPLERSASHRVVTGVCGGLGRRLDIDPLVFRVVIAVLCLWGGVGLFIYGVAWLMIPMEGTGKNELQRLMSGRVDGQSLSAVLVTVLGTGIFFSYMGAKDHVFPLLLIAALAFAALRYDPKRHQLPPREQAPPVVPESPPAAPNWWQRTDPLLKTDATSTADTATATGEPVSLTKQPPTDAALGEPLAGLTEPLAPLPPFESFDPFESAGTGGPSGPPERPRRVRGPWGLAVLVLAAGTAGVVYAVQAPHHVNALAVTASALAVVGLGLVLSGLLRRRAIGLAFVALLLSAATAVVGAAPWQHWSHTTWAPASAGQLQTTYDLRAGAATLDLRSVLPSPGQTVTTHVSLGAGTLKVLLPGGPAVPEVKLNAQTGAGELKLPDGRQFSGVGSSRSVDLNQGDAAAHGTVTVELQVGAGQVEVLQ